MDNQFAYVDHDASESGIDIAIVGRKRPLIMGILNVTPDSFSDGGLYLSREKAIEHAFRMADEGADIIDIGGESSRPGADPVPINLEIDRVLPVIEGLQGKLTNPISIDTRHSEVARLACQAGARIINDISGLQHDPQMASVAAAFESYLVIMHMRGNPKTMQADTKYDDLLGEIKSFLLSAADKASAAGVQKSKIIIDPGIGFGKSANQNLIILRNLDKFVKTGFPVLVGASRKSFIGIALNLPVEERLEGSLAAAIYSVLKGAAIVRVHDVKATKRAIKMIEEIEGAQE